MADRILNTLKRANDMRYIERRPKASLNVDHHSGHMPMLNIYSATERLVTVGVVSSDDATSPRAAAKQMGRQNMLYKVGLGERGLTVEYRAAHRCSHSCNPNY